jgi:hypothetical protein
MMFRSLSWTSIAPWAGLEVVRHLLVAFSQSTKHVKFGKHFRHGTIKILEVLPCVVPFLSPSGVSEAGHSLCTYGHGVYNLSIELLSFCFEQLTWMIHVALCAFSFVSFHA